MEGIAGTYGFNDGASVKRMLKAIAHRGPDPPKVFQDDRAALGARQRRAGGRARPVAELDGVALACDLGLYNKGWLLERFAAPGDGALSDQELLLRMYARLGTGMFSYLDGGFAVAVSDRGRTVLARDRYGLKPLYWSGGARRGTYSSEIKSQLLAGGGFEPFPPGRVFVQGKGLSNIGRRRTWPAVRVSGDRAETLRSLVVDGVRGAAEGSRRLNILLSGGIDSSVVASAAALVADDLKTVCVGAEGGPDLGMARAVAERLGTDHREVLYDVDQMLEVLDDVTYAAETFDYPLVRSCIPNFIATRAFEDGTRVTLCGEGGDEIFAGYDYMRDIRGEARLRAERSKLLRTGHMTGFQRVDRMTASASLDGRMPLMAGPVVEFGLATGRRWLLGPRPEQSKMVLREAFADLLPGPVMARRKQRFSDGAGSIHALVEVAEEIVTDREFERERKALPRNRVRTKEELLYFRSFAKHFGGSESAMRAVGFTPRP